MADKIAVITGSSSGFGLLTAVELAKAGFRVVASLRDLGRRSRLDEAAAAAGVAAKIDVRRLDMTEIDTIPGFIDGVVRDHGRIDVLVNNAGFAVAGFAELLWNDDVADGLRILLDQFLQPVVIEQVHFQRGLDAGDFE